MLAMIIACGLHVTNASVECRAACTTPDAPVLTNPGAQSNALTSEYGYAVAVLASNPIAYWRLEDVAATTVTDFSSTPHAGAIVGQIARVQTGALADGSVAMRFPGVAGTRIEVDDEPFRLTNAVTVEAWVKADGVENAGSIFEKSVSGPLSYRLAQEAGSWTWKISGTFGDLQRWTPVTTADVGAWVHLVGTFDGVDTKLYKNGVLVHSHPAEGTLTTGSGLSRMGGLANDGYPLAGALDEVAVYGAALTAGQVAYHYALRTSVPTVSLQLTATDGDSDPLRYSATGLPPGLLIHPTTGLISGNPTTAGTYSVTATATDPAELSSSQTFSWTITTPAAVNPNRPIITNPGNQSSALTHEHGYPGAVLMANPIGYWRLEDYASVTVTDWSGHGHAGTAAGRIVQGIAGPLSDGSLAMQFDGEVGTRIDIADDAAFRLTNAVTVEAWVKTTQGYATGSIFDKTRDGVSAASYLLMQEGDAWVWRIEGSFGTLNRWTPVTASDVGAWVHLVGTFDGTTTRLYKNGVLVHSTEAVGTLTATAGVTRIGLLGVNAYAFPGSIDEVAVYGAALSAGQIASHYAVRTTTSSVSLAITASDPDGDALTYSATGLPPGLIINPITGVISGNPTTPGSCDATVAVRDPGGLAASQTFTWTVTTTVSTNPHRPVLTNPGNQTSPVTTNYGYPTSILSSTPVGYWRLDDGAGTSVMDRAATPHAGTIHGGVTFGQTGALADGSLAMRFDGVTGSRVEIPTTSVLELTSAVTVSLWAKTDQQSAYGGLFDKTIGGATDQSYELLQEADRWSWWLWGTFGVVNVWTPVEAEDVGNWVHIVATFDGTTSRLYKNGVLVASGAAEGTLTAGEGVAQIGHLGSNIFSFTGLIDEVAVYGSALSESVIANQYSRRTAPAAVTLQLSATDPDGDSLLYTATGLPSSLVLNAATGVISGNPTASGTSNVTATVADPGGLMASQSFTWTFVPPTVTVAITSPFPGTIFNQPIDLAVSANATATNTTITQVEFFAGQTSLGTDSTAPYQVLWTAAPVGTYAVRAQAMDSSGGTTSSAPVSITVAQGGGAQGTLGTPIATPQAGTYGPGTMVTLTAADGTTIRFTTDGTTPTASSAVYGSPFLVSDGMEVRARAYQGNWTESPMLTALYHIDSAPPSVSAMVTPRPNADGWNNSPVTVTFACVDPGSGVAFCPSPVHFSTNGANQTLTRVARDNIGNESTVGVTVNIDTVAPSIAIATPPPTATQNASVSFSATLSDAESGLHQATCNNSTVAGTSGPSATITCTTTLVPGKNAIIVHASDIAGNNSSRYFDTTYGTNSTPSPLALTLSPTTLTLAVGTPRQMHIIDNYGRSLESNVEWSSSDSDIATVDENGRLVAVAIGTATITATHASLEAHGTVSVVSAWQVLSAGASVWTSAPSPSRIYDTVVSGAPFDQSETYYGLERDPQIQDVRFVSAFTEDGDVRWKRALNVPPGSWASLLGDTTRGVIVTTTGPEGSTITKYPELAAGWRYAAEYLNILGQSNDGTLFVNESTYHQLGYASYWDNVLVILDGATGGVRARIPLALNTTTVSGCGSSPGYSFSNTDGFNYGRAFAIDQNGVAHFQQSSADILESCSDTLVAHRLELWSVSGTGQLSVQPLASYSYSGYIYGPHDNSLSSVGVVVPSGQDELLVSWSDATRHLARVTPQGVTELAAPPGDLYGAAMGEQHTLFATTITSESVVAAIDSTTGNTLWTRPGRIIIRTSAGGGVAAEDFEATRSYDSDGEMVGEAPLASGGILHPDGGQVHISDDGNIEYKSGIPLLAANTFWTSPSGSALNNNTGPNCVAPLLPYRGPTTLNYTYYFDFDNLYTPGFDTDNQAVFDRAAVLWNEIGYDHPIGRAAHTPNEVEDPGNVIIKRWDLIHSVPNPRGLTLGYTVTPTWLTGGEPHKSPIFDIAASKFGVIADMTLNTLTTGALYTFQAVAVHEFGHLLGLEHVPEACSPSDSIMFPRVGSNRPSEILTNPTTAFDAVAIQRLKAARQQ